MATNNDVYNSTLMCEHWKKLCKEVNDLNNLVNTQWDAKRDEKNIIYNASKNNKIGCLSVLSGFAVGALVCVLTVLLHLNMDTSVFGINAPLVQIGILFGGLILFFPLGKLTAHIVEEVLSRKAAQPEIKKYRDNRNNFYNNKPYYIELLNQKIQEKRDYEQMMLQQCCIHQKYWNVAYILNNYIAEGRAYDLRDAINIFENERRAQRFQQQQLDILNDIADAQYEANANAERSANESAEYAKKVHDMAQDLYYDSKLGL